MSQTQKKSIPWKLLVISLAIVLLFSFLASMFNTGMFTVDVSRISFETERGTLSGLLYMPKGAGKDSPRPAISVTHGYLNSAEMQDANAIELSRRGYVVLALDMYDHGHSAGNAENTGGFFKFWPRAQYDAVQYLYKQDYVLKDEKGNGIIGVTGHSMGGFSSAMAMFYDEQDYLAAEAAEAGSGIRKIFCGLTEGADYQWISGMYSALLLKPEELGTIGALTPETHAAYGGGRTQGKVAARFDEFFFNADNAPSGTVREKDFVSTSVGKTFLEQEEPEAGKWYDTADGGKRIVYEPAETHPWNHFSTVTTGSAIEFYTEAFADYQENIKNAQGQIWLWKEIFECAAMVGFILFILALANLLIRLPFFSFAKTEAPAVQPGAHGAARLSGIIIMLIALLLPAILFETMYGWSPASDGMWFIFCGAVFAALFGLAFLIKGENKKQRIGGCVALAGGIGLAVLSRFSLFAESCWNAPIVGDIGKWTVGSTFIALIIMSLVFLFSKSREGISFKDYGVTFKPLAIVGGLCTALVTVIAAYGLLFLVDAIFKTDFRIWTFAFKTFDANIIPTILRYLPTFIAYYIVSTAAICINTNNEHLKGWKGYLVAVALNCGGIIIWLLRQYITLFSTGVAAHPGAALSGIVLVAMVFTLAVAACISRYLYKRTGNIWLPAFLNGLLMTIMTVANTTVYFK